MHAGSLDKKPLDGQASIASALRTVATEQAGVAALAGEHARPCVVLAGRVDVGNREMRALGVESAYAMVERAGDRALTEPGAALEELAAHVAGQWSP